MSNTFLEISLVFLSGEWVMVNLVSFQGLREGYWSHVTIGSCPVACS